MKAELIGEKPFVGAILASHSVWVGWHDSAVLVVPQPQGWNALYAWSDREKAIAFLSKIRPDCRAVEVPLSLLCDSWLSDDALNVQEVLANASSTLSSALSFNRSEFLASMTPAPDEET